MKERIYLVCLISLFVFLSLASYSFSGTENRFSGDFVRLTGDPIIELRNFSGVAGTAKIKLYNGGIVDETFEPVSSSAIKLNGNEIFGPSNFNQNVRYLEAEVSLMEGDNTLNVLLKGKPGGRITIVVEQTVPDEVNGFLSVGDMMSQRTAHTSTLLMNGKVLIAGGDNLANAGPYLSSAEIYDPLTGTFTPTGNMSTGRAAHTATLLPNGKVLIAGGADWYLDHHALNTAELYDPETGTFTPTGNMNSKRMWQSAILLKNGKVLIAGGFNNDYTVYSTEAYLNTAELYDPQTGTFSSTGSMINKRMWNAIVPLNDGKVLMAGGTHRYGGWLRECEIYNPDTGQFAATGSMNVPRWIGTGVVLPDGKVLFSGGNTLSEIILNTAELYDPLTGTFSYTAANMNEPRSGNMAALLPNGKVLIAGGQSQSHGGVFLDSAELYDPSTELFTITENMNGTRYLGAFTTLSNGDILITGGWLTPSIILQSAEIYHSTE